MALEFPGDFPSPEDTYIQEWVDVVLPNKIANLTTSIADYAAQITVVTRTEGIFEKIYTHFSNITHAGWIPEARWLDGSYFTQTFDEAAVQAIALDPFSSALFPTSNLTPDPLQISELTGVFDASVGASEEEALIAELAEYDRIPPPAPQPDPAELLAQRVIQQTALAAQISALGTVLSELDAGDVGYSNSVTALADAVIAKTRVDNLIATPAFYSEAERRLQIADRLSGGATYNVLEPLVGISNRVAQITSDSVTYVDQRFFWLRKRLNLQWGSLYYLRSLERQSTNLTNEKAAYEQELAYYQSIGA